MCIFDSFLFHVINTQTYEIDIHLHLHIYIVHTFRRYKCCFQSICSLDVNTSLNRRPKSEQNAAFLLRGSPVMHGGCGVQSSPQSCPSALWKRDRWYLDTIQFLYLLFCFYYCDDKSYMNNTLDIGSGEYSDRLLWWKTQLEVMPQVGGNKAGV